MALTLNDLNSSLSIQILVFSVVFTLIVTLFAFGFCKVYDAPLEYTYEDRPSLFLLCLRALSRGLGRNQGSLDEREIEKDKNLTVVVRDCRVNKNNLAQYCKLCGYLSTEDTLPACYLEIFFIPLMINLAASKYFKLSPIGLIHIKQTLSLHTAIAHLLKEPFDLECSIVEYRPTYRGVETDVLCKVYDRREMCVWEAVTTLLSRNDVVKDKKDHKPVDAQTQGEDEPSSNGISRTVHTAADLGLQYARVSGDWSPHHLYKWLAALLGYQRPIAHGMWTLSRAVADLDNAGKFPLTAPLHIDAKFKRPVFLPGDSFFSYTSHPDKDMYTFVVEDLKTRSPQLQGSITRKL